MASLFDRQESLQDRTTKFNLLLADLVTDNDLAEMIKQDFHSLAGAWEYFCEDTLRQTEQQRTENAQILMGAQLRNTMERAKQKRKRRRMQMKEMALDVQEQDLQNSLERFVSLYEENLVEMEFALQEAKQRRMRKETEHLKRMLTVDRELEDVLQGNTKTIPRLVLEGLVNSSVCSSVPISVDSHDEVSNRSNMDSVNEHREDISQRLPKPPAAQAPPKVKFQHRHREIDSPRTVKDIVDQSSISDSQALDSLMDQLKSHNFRDNSSKFEFESDFRGNTSTIELRRMLEKVIEFNFDDPVISKQEVLAKVKEARKLKDLPSAYKVYLS